MFQEPISGFLSNFGTDGVFRLLWFLEELGDFLEGRVWFLLFSFGILDILEKEAIGLIVNLLGGSLGVGVDVFFESAEPVDLLSWHDDLNLVTIFL